MDQPIPSYLASVAVAPYAFVNDVFQGQQRSIPILLAAQPQDTANLKASFIHLKNALQCFEEKFGPYPFDRIGYVVVPFSSGAMEHATNIAYPQYAVDGTTSNESGLMAHELSHHWWGDLATTENSTEMWINEGWASFCEALFDECFSGKNAYVANITDKAFDSFRWAHARDGAYLPVSGVPANATYGTTVYKKGALMVNALRNLMGDASFFAACKSFLTKNRFTDVSTIGLRNEFQKFTSVPLIPFFDHWILDKGNTDVLIHHFDVNNQVVHLNLQEQIRLCSTTYYPIPLHIQFLDQTGNSMTFPMSLRQQQLDTLITMPQNFHPITAIINPDYFIPLSKTFDVMNISSTGIKTAANGLLTFTVQSIKDSVLCLVEHHYCGPNALLDPIKGYKLSNERHWRIDGNWGIDFKSTAFFNYDGSSPANKSAGFLDNELITSTEDSLVLLYRPRADTAWSIHTDNTKQMGSSKTDKVGRFWVTQLQKGEYCFAYKDVTAGMSATKPLQRTIKIFPNPSRQSFELIAPENHQEGHFKILNALGSEVSVEISHHSNLYQISFLGAASGTYFVVWTDAEGTITEKVVLY